MLFSYWIMLFLPVLMFPSVSHRLYQKAYDREKTQVGLDNAAILFGQADVDWLNFLDDRNRQLAALDQTHHPSHFCRFHPPTAAACLPVDQAAEAAISALHIETGARIAIDWGIASARAYSELGRLEVVPRAVRRPLLAPIASVRCKVCALSIGWRVTQFPFTQLESAHEPPLFSSVQVSPAKGKSGFDYALK